VTTATAADPAGGDKPGEYKKGIRDWFCAVTGGRTKTGFIDIFDIRMSKLPPEGQIDTLLDVYEKWRPRRIGIEENKYENLYALSMKKTGQTRALYPSITTFKQNKMNKQTRILGSQPLLMDTPQIVRFAKHLFTEVPEFFAQYDEFPATHDDGPDATEMLIRMLERKVTRGRPTGMGGTSYWKGRV